MSKDNSYNQLQNNLKSILQNANAASNRLVSVGSDLNRSELRTYVSLIVGLNKFINAQLSSLGIYVNTQGGSAQELEGQVFNFIGEDTTGWELLQLPLYASQDQLENFKAAFIDVNTKYTTQSDVLNAMLTSDPLNGQRIAYLASLSDIFEAASSSGKRSITWDLRLNELANEMLSSLFLAYYLLSCRLLSLSEWALENNLTDDFSEELQQILDQSKTENITDLLGNTSMPSVGSAENELFFKDTFYTSLMPNFGDADSNVGAAFIAIYNWLPIFAARPTGHPLYEKFRGKVMKEGVYLLKEFSEKALAVEVPVEKLAQAQEAFDSVRATAGLPKVSLVDYISEKVELASVKLNDLQKSEYGAGAAFLTAGSTVFLGVPPPAALVAAIVAGIANPAKGFYDEHKELLDRGRLVAGYMEVLLLLNACFDGRLNAQRSFGEQRFKTFFIKAESCSALERHARSAGFGSLTPDRDNLIRKAISFTALVGIVYAGKKFHDKITKG